MDCVNLEKRKGCLPSGGNSRSVAESGGNRARKFPAGGALASSSSQPAPRGSCPASTAEPWTVGNLPRYVCDSSGSMSLAGKWAFPVWSGSLIEVSLSQDLPSGGQMRGLLEQMLASVSLMDTHSKGNYFLIFYPRGQIRRAGAPTPTGGALLLSSNLCSMSAGYCRAEVAAQWCWILFLEESRKSRFMRSLLDGKSWQRIQYFTETWSTISLWPVLPPSGRT